MRISDWSSDVCSSDLKTPLGKRRTEIGDVPSEVVIPLEAVVEREPVTVLCSAKGWVRTLKGHQEDVSDATYKEGDRERFVVLAQTTDKLLVFATNGRFYTLGVDQLPGGRSFGAQIGRASCRARVGQVG